VAQGTRRTSYLTGKDPLTRLVDQRRCEAKQAKGALHGNEGSYPTIERRKRKSAQIRSAP
jgi:hypothetical protein